MLVTLMAFGDQSRDKDGREGGMLNENAAATMARSATMPLFCATFCVRNCGESRP